jgi:hypothetical protein
MLLFVPIATHQNHTQSFLDARVTAKMTVTIITRLPPH